MSVKVFSADKPADNSMAAAFQKLPMTRNNITFISKTFQTSGKLKKEKVNNLISKYLSLYINHNVLPKWKED